MDVNGYTYGDNSPTNFSDPSGKTPEPTTWQCAMSGACTRYGSAEPKGGGQSDSTKNVGQSQVAQNLVPAEPVPESEPNSENGPAGIGHNGPPPDVTYNDDPEQNWNRGWDPDPPFQRHHQATGLGPFPENNGFLYYPEHTYLDVGDIVDRIGSDRGAYVAPDGTSIFARGLKEDSLTAPYHRYVVVRRIDHVAAGTVASWGMGGGGYQYLLPKTVIQLLNDGYLRELTETK